MGTSEQEHKPLALSESDALTLATAHNVLRRLSRDSRRFELNRDSIFVLGKIDTAEDVIFDVINSAAAYLDDGTPPQTAAAKALGIIQSPRSDDK